MTPNHLTLRLRLLGRPLFALRRAAGLTQKEIAGSLGYTTAQFISNWERGVSVPPIDAIPNLSALFGVKFTALIELIFAYEQAEVQVRKKQAIARIRQVMG